ncbi:MAG: TRAP transporter substrate-binding protein DctP [Rickettsiales bacterium]
MKKSLLTIFSFSCFFMLHNICSANNTSNKIDQSQNSAGNVSAVDTKKINTNEQFKARVHYALPDGSVSDRIMIKPFAKKIEEATNGKIKFEFYPSMQLGGKPSDIVAQVENGQVEMVFTVAEYHPGRFPSLEALDQMGAITLDHVRNNNVARQFFNIVKDQPEFKNIKIIAIASQPKVMMHFKENIKLQNIKDLKGLNMRASNKPVGAAWTELGINPIYCTAKELFELLLAGNLQGAGAPFELLKSTKIYQQLNQTLVAPMFTNVFLLIMNKDFFNSLPKDLQEKIDQYSMNEEFIKEVGANWMAEEKKAIGDMLLTGKHKFYDLDDKTGDFIEIKVDTVKDLEKNPKLLEANIEKIWEIQNNNVKKMHNNTSYFSQLKDKLVLNWKNTAKGKDFYDPLMLIINENTK